jgi:hypothetical protein
MIPMTRLLALRSGRTSRLAAILSVLAFLPIVVLGAYVIFALPSASAISVLQATTESVSFRAQVPDLAQMRLTGFSLSFEAPNAGTNLGFKEAVPSASARNRTLCLDGILAPEPDSMVTYRRFGTGAPVVVIERTDGKPAASFSGSSKDIPAAVRASSWIRLEGKADDDDSEKKGCPGTPSARLPIHGAAQIGSELKPAGSGQEASSGVLLEGTLNIFARALDVGPWRESAPRIYPASVSDISLPAGSRIMEYTGNGGTPQPWTGFVRTDADEALSVSVTTPAMRLALVRPGVGMTPEVLSIGLFTQLANDPILSTIQILAAVLFVVFQALSAGVSWIAASHSAVTQTRE